MKSSTTVISTLLLVISPFAAAQSTLPDPDTLAKQLPSCSSGCVNSAFSAAKCNSGDWDCFCTQGTTNQGLATIDGQTTSECQAEIKPDGHSSCSLDDIKQTISTIAKICDSDLLDDGPTHVMAGDTASMTASAGNASTAAPAMSSGTSGTAASGSMTTAAATKAASGSATVSTSTMHGIAGDASAQNAGFLLAMAALALGMMA